MVLSVYLHTGTNIHRLKPEAIYLLSVLQIYSRILTGIIIRDSVCKYKQCGNRFEKAIVVPSRLRLIIKKYCRFTVLIQIAHVQMKNIYI